MHVIVVGGIGSDFLILFLGNRGYENRRVRPPRVPFHLI